MPDYTLTTSPSMARRHARETRFKWYGRTAIMISIAFMLLMFTAIIYRGAGAFQQTQIALDVDFTESIIDPSGSRDPTIIKQANYKPLLQAALAKHIPSVTDRREKNKLYKLISSGTVFNLADRVANNPSLIGQTQTIWVPTSSEVDLFIKGKIDADLPLSLIHI